ncbi:MAG: hypothetical protein ABW143_08380, partial [Acidimicrobiales bacterium]
MAIGKWCMSTVLFFLIGCAAHAVATRSAHRPDDRLGGACGRWLRSAPVRAVDSLVARARLVAG